MAFDARDEELRRDISLRVAQTAVVEDQVIGLVEEHLPRAGGGIRGDRPCEGCHRTGTP